MNRGNRDPHRIRQKPSSNRRKFITKERKKIGAPQLKTPISLRSVQFSTKRPLLLIPIPNSDQAYPHVKHISDTRQPSFTVNAQRKKFAKMLLKTQNTRILQQQGYLYSTSSKSPTMRQQFGTQSQQPLDQPFKSTQINPNMTQSTRRATISSPMNSPSQLPTPSSSSTTTRHRKPSTPTTSSTQYIKPLSTAAMSSDSVRATGNIIHPDEVVVDSGFADSEYDEALDAVLYGRQVLDREEARIEESLRHAKEIKAIGDSKPINEQLIRDHQRSVAQLNRRHGVVNDRFHQQLEKQMKINASRDEINTNPTMNSNLNNGPISTSNRQFSQFRPHPQHLQQLSRQNYSQSKGSSNRSHDDISQHNYDVLKQSRQPIDQSVDNQRGSAMSSQFSTNSLNAGSNTMGNLSGDETDTYRVGAHSSLTQLDANRMNQRAKHADPLGGVDLVDNDVVFDGQRQFYRAKGNQSRNTSVNNWDNTASEQNVMNIDDNTDIEFNQHHIDHLNQSTQRFGRQFAQKSPEKRSDNYNYDEVELTTTDDESKLQSLSQQTDQKSTQLTKDQQHPDESGTDNELYNYKGDVDVDKMKFGLPFFHKLLNIDAYYDSFMKDHPKALKGRGKGELDPGMYKNDAKPTNSTKLSTKLSSIDETNTNTTPKQSSFQLYHSEPFYSSKQPTTATPTQNDLPLQRPKSMPSIPPSLAKPHESTYQQTTKAPPKPSVIHGDLNFLPPTTSTGTTTTPYTTPITSTSVRNMSSRVKNSENDHFIQSQLPNEQETAMKTTSGTVTPTQTPHQFINKPSMIDKTLFSDTFSTLQQHRAFNQQKASLDRAKAQMRDEVAAFDGMATGQYIDDFHYDADGIHNINNKSLQQTVLNQSRRNSTSSWEKTMNQPTTMGTSDFHRNSGMSSNNNEPINTGLQFIDSNYDADGVHSLVNKMQTPNMSTNTTNNQFDKATTSRGHQPPVNDKSRQQGDQQQPPAAIDLGDDISARDKKRR